MLAFSGFEVVFLVVLSGFLEVFVSVLFGFKFFYMTISSTSGFQMVLSLLRDFFIVSSSFQMILSGFDG